MLVVVLVVISTLDDYCWLTVVAFWKTAAVVCTHWNLVAFSQSVVSGQVVNGNCCCCCRCWWSMKKHYCHRPLLSLRERETFWWVFVSSTLSVREAVSCFFCFCWSYSSLVLRLEIGTAAAAAVFLLFSPLIGQLDWLTERLRERKMNRKMIVVNYGCCCCICCWSAEVNCRHKTNKQIRSRERKREARVQDGGKLTPFDACSIEQSSLFCLLPNFTINKWPQFTATTMVGSGLLSPFFSFSFNLNSSVLLAI